ncbi:AAA family ATPase [Bacillus sp. TH25]|uniref:AAA family ATPase n=1 Tax=Bacillus sp. TH25 TaxID=2796391 RepID=UPI00191150C6|nr:AAA family ATPase [Bacillus sp. TH25]MBK5435280.1 AAA family ATPase [Bacillus sp. TH25]
MLNISTNYLAATPYKKVQSIVAEGTNYKFGEMKRQIQFVYGMTGTYNQLPLPFILPNQVDIFTTRGAIVPLEDMSQHSELHGYLYSQLGNFKRNKDFKMFNIKGRGEYKVNRFAGVIIGHILYEIERSEFRHKLIDIHFDFNDNKLNNNYRNKYFELIRGILELARIISEKDEELIVFSDMLKALASLMIQYYKYDFNKVSPYYGRMILDLTYNTNGIDKESLKRFIYNYEKACINHEFLKFSWRSMSSGEMALLNIYARFYFLLSLKDIQENPENDLIILIDEGEVYLHPHWQSQIINSLIDYFSIIFKNKAGLKQRNIQIILTSNSPFVVSDLPSMNIIFLKKEGDKTVVVDGLEDYHQTFAANIHSLLSHSFFMEDGVTGTFAKRKINEIIDLLVNKDINTILQNEKKIEKTINLIGEPLIRNKLSQMLSDKLSIRMMSVEREIKDLKARLEELERWKGDKNKA